MFAKDAWERAGFDFNLMARYSRLLAKPAPTLFLSIIWVNDIAEGFYAEGKTL
ncbi:hypothetical protein IQ264_23705 [Phormidium sp. LEGE 05292]|uniref:hypothetical protein n=1 Tax=[Phormidium] sp. LEGE 05292 TaxID=767427 RepID=UPI00188278AD|nr:hypothetical protein [Phormidium sp. LEGE 05292]MBE9228431.1 hypothetical protein [Phormidium sp. LEGE 05292]